MKLGGRSWGVLQRVEEVGGGGEVFRFGCEAVDEAPLVEPHCEASPIFAMPDSITTKGRIIPDEETLQ